MPRPPRRPLAALVLVLLSVVAVLVAGCGDDEPSTTADRPGAPGALDLGPHAGATSPDGTAAPSPGPPASDTLAGASSSVIRFEAPPEVTCSGSTVDVPVVYVTTGLDAVGFAVDGAAVRSTPPSTSGQHTVALPCDGRVHTVMLVGSGPSGPAFATRAVAARPA